MLNRTHSKILEIEGGKDEFKKMFVLTIKYFKNANLSFMSTASGKFTEYSSDGKIEHFYVNLTLNLKKEDEVKSMKTRQLRIKKLNSKTWHFFSNTQGAEKIGTLIKKKPKDFKLGEIE